MRPSRYTTRIIWPVLIFERTSHWTAIIERSLGTAGDRSVRWQPHFPALLEDLAEMPDEVVVLTLKPDAVGFAQVQAVRATADSARVMCLLEGEDPAWEWAAREWGVRVILPETSPRREILASIARLAKADCPARASP